MTVFHWKTINTSCQQKQTSDYTILQIGHTSNKRVIRATNLLAKIRDFNTKYYLTKVYSNSYHLELNTKSQFAMVKDQTAISYSFILDYDNSANLAQIFKNFFDSLCFSCITSKSSYITIQNKIRTKTNKKLEKVYINLWGPHQLAWLFGKRYVLILFDAKT